MYDKRLTHLMDQVLFSCFVLMTIFFLIIDTEDDPLQIDLPPTPQLSGDFSHNLEEAEFIIRNTVILSGEDLKYLRQYDPADALFILKYSQMYNIPILYLYRQDYLESKLGKYPINDRERGLDIGFKQLNSRYMDYYIEKYFILDEPFDPLNNEHSIQVGCAYLKDLYNEFFEDWRLAFQAYNAGPTRVRSFSVPPMTEEYAECILNGYSENLKYIEAAARGMH